MDFAILADHTVKESKKLNKYLDLARELKKLWNMEVTVTSVIVGTISKNQEKKSLDELEIRGRIETIQNTSLLKSVRILRRVLEN